jgi:hypothetical protein
MTKRQRFSACSRSHTQPTQATPTTTRPALRRNVDALALHAALPLGRQDHARGGRAHRPQPLRTRQLFALTMSSRLPLTMELK